MTHCRCGRELYLVEDDDGAPYAQPPVCEGCDRFPEDCQCEVST